ncbi:site-specific integrase [Arthrobacter crystallopoietes]|uniref:hypothetical protein n=1 Tax=Crystallibacter crystallopoietes TaxID=37928 RepID=UPI003D1C69D7
MEISLNVFLPRNRADSTLLTISEMPQFEDLRAGHLGILGLLFYFVTQKAKATRRQPSRFQRAIADYRLPINLLQSIHSVRSYSMVRPREEKKQVNQPVNMPTADIAGSSIADSAVIHHAPRLMRELKELVSGNPNVLFSAQAAGEMLYLHGNTWMRKEFRSYSSFQKGNGAEVGNGLPLNDAQDRAVGDSCSAPDLANPDSVALHLGNKGGGKESGVLGGDVRAEVSGEPINAFSGDLGGSDGFSARHGSTVDQCRNRPTLHHLLVGAPADLGKDSGQYACQTPQVRYITGRYIDQSNGAKGVAELGKAVPTQGISLIDAVEAVLKHWRETNALTEQSLKKFDDLLHRYAKYAAANQVPLLSDQSEALASQWIHARGTKRGVPVKPAAGTMSTRRAALRKFYADAEHLCLSESGLAVRTVVPPRAKGLARPLTDGEARLVWLIASDSGASSRRQIVFALLLSGIHSSEASHITVQDVDVANQRVWAHGDSERVTPRWVPIAEPYWSAVTERIGYLRASIRPHDNLKTRRLAQGNPTKSITPGQSLTAAACAEVFKIAGYKKYPDITPSSVSLYAGAHLLRTGERIEKVVVRLGYASMDSCAKALGYDWQAGEYA